MALSEDGLDVVVRVLGRAHAEARDSVPALLLHGAPGVQNEVLLVVDVDVVRRSVRQNQDPPALFTARAQQVPACRSAVPIRVEKSAVIPDSRRRTRSP